MKNVAALLILGFCLAMQALIGASQGYADNSNKEFLDYINNEKWDINSVLVLGVGATEEPKGIRFDKVIPVSRAGQSIEDSFRATIAKLGVSTANLEDLHGKRIRELDAHSWGSSEMIHLLNMDPTIKVKELNLFGSPHSIVMSLQTALERGQISKVRFHINVGQEGFNFKEEDLIALLRHIPGLTSKGSIPFGPGESRIEVHYYYTTASDQNTKIDNPMIGFTKYHHYNSLYDGHGLKGYLLNWIHADPEHLPRWAKSVKEPFTNIPQYWTNGGRKESMTEAEIMIAFARGKERALVVGEGKEAQYLYKQLEKMLGTERVKWVKDAATWQKEAYSFGADVVLGVRSQTLPRLPLAPPEAEVKRLDEKKLTSPPPPPPLVAIGPQGSASAAKQGNNHHDPGPGPGGVMMDSNPQPDGKGGADIKKKILQSRPQREGAWPAQ